MDFSENQLALAAWLYVYGGDREISSEEAHVLWELLHEDPHFYVGSTDLQMSLDYIISDYRLMLGLFVEKKLDWNSIMNRLKSLSMDRKCEILHLIMETAKVLQRSDTDMLREEWAETTSLMHGMDLTFSDYDRWSASESA